MEKDQPAAKWVGFFLPKFSSMNETKKDRVRVFYFLALNEALIDAAIHAEKKYLAGLLVPPGKKGKREGAETVYNIISQYCDHELNDGTWEHKLRFALQKRYGPLYF